MNFSGFDFDARTRALLENMAGSDRMSHAIIIESVSRERAAELARYLSALAVCKEASRPCLSCRECHLALEKTHPDIQYIPPDKKSKSKNYSIEQMREIIRDAYTVSNNGGGKVFIFEKSDERFPPIPQNAFLKLLEEPPRNVFFLLLTNSVQSFLPTVLSRCTVIKLRAETEISEAALESAEKIVEGILSPREYDLLLALQALCNKDSCADIITAVRALLMDALAVLSGARANVNPQLAAKTASRMTRRKIIEMMELSSRSLDMAKQNTNINLLTTWMCGEYRRISWQR